MFCRNCGFQIGKGKVCYNCGSDPLDNANFCQVCGVVTFHLQKKCITCNETLVQVVLDEDDNQASQKREKPTYEVVVLKTNKKVTLGDDKIPEIQHLNKSFIFSLIIPLWGIILFLINFRNNHEEAKNHLKAATPQMILLFPVINSLLFYFLSLQYGILDSLYPFHLVHYLFLTSLLLVEFTLVYLYFKNLMWLYLTMGFYFTCMLLYILSNVLYMHF